MLQRCSDSYDVVIVGARCAGSPLATLLARRGLRVCVVERASLPSDTPSTHGIQPGGVQALERLGVLPELLAVAPPVETVRIAFNQHRAEVEDFASLLGAPMVNVRRITLDVLLSEHARAAGAEVRTGTAVTGLLIAGERVVGVETTAGELRAPLVVGADGARSTVARLVGAEEYHRAPPHRAFLWSYFEGVEDHGNRLWIGSLGGDSFLASPTDGGLFLAAFVAPIERRDELRSARTAAFEDGIRRWPELGAALARARRAAPVQLMSNWHGFFRRSAGPGWVLAGDAGHFKDPTPGQGIADALRQVERLAPAIEQALDGPAPSDEPLHEWWRWRDEDAWDMYWFAADMGRSQPTLRISAAADRRMASEAALVERLLRVLNHEIPASQLLPTSAVLTIVYDALRRGNGSRLAVLEEARGLALEELRRRRARRRKLGRG